MVTRGQLRVLHVNTKEASCSSGWRDVAVKVLSAKKGQEKRHVDSFLMEMEMLLKVGRHVNIVNLVGLVLRGKLK